MKSKIIKAIIACVVIIGVGAGGYYTYNSSSKVNIKITTSKYYISTAKKQSISNTIQGTGSAYSSVTKDISPSYDGTISGLSVKVGDTVTAGQTLFTCTSTDLQKSATNAENNLAKQKLQLSTDETSEATYSAKIVTDNQAITDAEAALSTAKASANTSTSSTVTASSETISNNSASSSTPGGNSSGTPAGNNLQNSTNSVSNLQDNLTKLKQTLASDTSSEKDASNKIATDKISISDAETALATANTNLSKETVTSPIAGLVTAVNNANDDSVKSGTTVLTVVDTNSMKIKVTVDELDVAKVKLGQSATIKFDAISDKSFTGAVESISQTGTTSNSVTTYNVVVSISNPSGIKLGMTANVAITLESKDNALVIPADALVESNGKKYVKVPNSTNNGGTNSSSSSSDNNYNLVEIKTGIENQSYMEVTNGLTEGEQVEVQSISSGPSGMPSNGFHGGSFSNGSSTKSSTTKSN